MKRIYCDTGGYRRELKQLQEDGAIELFQFHYENRNKNIQAAAPASNPTWDEMNYRWDELKDVTWADLGRESEKRPIIETIVGANNIRDVKHLDSAFMANCDAFLTSDKGDISSRSEEIFEATGIRVFHFQDDWGSFLEFCRSDS